MSQCQRAHEHTFTEIAPEGHDEAPNFVWEWCIRCGALKLGGDIFKPGPTQTEIIQADE